ncbi:MAG: class I SAM-dependent methyltransferase [bacterium]
MASRKTKVFISMPFTGKTFENLSREREDLHALAATYDLELPEQFIGYQFAEDFKTKDYDPSFVLAKDKKYIKESDIVVADFSSPSIGTDCETTIAKELYDKKIIGIVPDVNKRKHAWLRFYCDDFVSSVEEAFELIRAKYANHNHPEHVDKRQYDSIAVEYQLVEATPIQKYVYDPNARELLGEYGTGKKVAVFHCASGHRARIAKEAGAKEVIGIDTSFRQISLAREIELSKPQGIEYRVLNAYSKDFPDEFPKEYNGSLDVVLGFFLIDHAQTETELQKLAENVYSSLAPGGVFIAMLDDSEARTPTDPKYGVAIEPLEGKGDASQRRIVIYQNMKDGEDRAVLHFFNFEWTRATVQRVFSEAGFAAEFKDPFVAPEGKERLGEDFWRKYEEDPDNVLFICRK